LGFNQTEVFNPGFDVISDVIITLSLPAPSRIIDVAAVSSLDQCQLSTTVEADKATVSVPFLNPYRGHQHTLVIAVTYDGDPKELRITGSGSGWSLRRVGIRGTPVRQWFVIFPILAMLGLVGLAKWYGGWLAKRYGIGENELSLRALVAALPFIFLLVVFIIWLFRFSIQPKPKSTKETLEKIKFA